MQSIQDTTMPSQPRPVDPPVTAASIAFAKDSARDELRTAATEIAASKHHRLGRWFDLDDDGTEIAYCRTCRRRALIDIERDPHLAGDALRVVCTRPDAFLAHQHDSITRGGTR